MAEGKKKMGIGKIVLIVLVALVVIGGIGSMMGGGSTGSADNSGEAGQQETAEVQEAAPEPYVITDEAVDTSNPYMFTITGTLTNNTDQDKSYIQVQYNLYDAEGAQIGTALANTNNLKAGGAWKFEASSFDIDDPAQVASWEMIEVTGF